uniref:Cysteine proteinase RD21a n=1 Tax=Anthurium amnicola TaxID=1678845 RepID=A0A1D1YBX8_9ARAE
MGNGRITVLLLSVVLLSVAPSGSCSAGEWPSSGQGTEDVGAGGVEGGQELFERWMEKHRKVYAHPGEKARRYANFLGNLAFVRKRNAEGRRTPSSGQGVGMNVFADLSNEEFREVYSSRALRKKAAEGRGARRRAGEGRVVAGCDAPASLDWRKRGAVTAVKNQGECGSCWAFSSTGAMEGINAITTGELISLSEQELVDCDTTNEGCDGGYMDYAFEWVINNGGIDSEANYPYTGQADSVCNTTKEEIKVVSIDGYGDVATSESALLCAVVQQPVSVGIDGSSLDFQLYTGGIYDGDCSGNPDDIDHAVLVVGYGQQGGTDYWIVKNSWGTDWGMQGYIYIRRNTGLPYGVCAIDAMASYPTKQFAPAATPPSPAPPPPSPPPPPTPPSPSPSQCGDYSYCPSDETCCCLVELGGFCLIYGCCAYQNAVCCTGTVYCCPQDYPICDVPDGLCLQHLGDVVGVAARKRKLAKHKFPWTKAGDTPQQYYQPLLWKRDGVAALR